MTSKRRVLFGAGGAAVLAGGFPGLPVRDVVRTGPSNRTRTLQLDLEGERR